MYNSGEKATEENQIVELEKKVQDCQEKLRRAAKREGELENEVARLTAVIRAINNLNISKAETQRLSLGVVQSDANDHDPKLEVNQRFPEKIVQEEKVIPAVQVLPKPKYGLEVIRKCSPDEETLIKKQYQKIQNELEQKINTIVLYNVFRDGRFSAEPSQCLELHNWVLRLIEEIEPGAGCYPIVQTFILNPKDNFVTQDYHMDFAEHMRTLFVNMDYLTSLNSTQFFKEPLEHHTKLSLRGAKQYGSDEKEMLIREDKQFIQVSQMICKPFTILLCKPGTIHRGIANRSGVNRVVFSVCYTNVKGFESGQPKIGTQKMDIE